MRVTNDKDQKTDILFLWDRYADKESLKLLPITQGIDEAKYVGKAIVWQVLRKDYIKSGMSSLVGTELYRHMTARNVNTVRKFATKIQQLKNIF